MSYLERLIVNALTFIGMSVLLPDKVYVSSIWIALIASFVLSILNMCVKPILHILSLPFTILTFGLFSFVINGIMLRMTSFFLGEANFSFSSFGVAVLVAIVMTFVNSIVTDHNTRKKYYS